MFQFDDLTVGSPVGEYEASSWVGFTVGSPYPAAGVPIPSNIAKDIPHIDPVSLRNYAIAPSGSGVLYGANYTSATGDSPGFGSFSFGNVNSLRAFSFACSTPGELNVPVACSLDVAASCVAYNGTIVNYAYSSTFSYTPTSPLNGTMQFVDFDRQANIPSIPDNKIGNNECYNYTFTATSQTLPHIALELDNVITTLIFYSNI